MNRRELTCVACPLGCSITVTFDGDAIAEVIGNTCKRGDAYARTECTNPTRMLTTTVKVVDGKSPVAPVKSANPIPKNMMMECMKEINKTTVKAPVKIGDTVIKNILGTGIDIVATNNAE